jgi:hypothetical protein
MNRSRVTSSLSSEGRTMKHTKAWHFYETTHKDLTKEALAEVIYG